MSKEKITNLPKFSFLKGYGDNDELYGRDVILHIGTGSVLEVLKKEDNIIDDESVYVEFSRTNHSIKHITGKTVRENYVLILHHTPFLDVKTEEDFIVKEIMLPTIHWYLDYCDMMDDWVISKGVDFINL